MDVASALKGNRQGGRNGGHHESGISHEAESRDGGASWLRDRSRGGIFETLKRDILAGKDEVARPLPSASALMKKL